MFVYYNFKFQLQLKIFAVAEGSDGTGICTIANGEVDVVVQDMEIELMEYAVGTFRASMDTASITITQVS